MTAAEQRAIEQRFRSDECHCGATKVRRAAFCGTCYSKLSAGLKAGLWKHWRDGFEEAYLAAVEALKG